MSRTKFQPVTVTLSAATSRRLWQATLFKRRVADQAVEMVRIALLALFPPRTAEDWNDKSRMQGAWGYSLLLFHDFARHLWHRLTGRGADEGEYAAGAAGQPHQLTLMVPAGFMRWIEEIARGRRMSVPDATVYAIEYGLRVLDSGGSDADEVNQSLRRAWREILRAVWGRLKASIKSGRHLTTACTRPPKRQLSCSLEGVFRRRCPSTHLSYIAAFQGARSDPAASSVRRGGTCLA
jgi:hypothetical protein